MKGKDQGEIRNSFDPEWCARSLLLESNNRMVSKEVGSGHGIVFCTEPFSEECTYVEFKVTINVPSKTKSHLFIGCVDK